MSFAKSRFVGIKDAASTISDGSRIVIAGSMVNAPMSLIRETIRAGVRELDLLVSPIGGINIDMLIGAGAARSVEFPQISLGEFGLAPNFRRAAENGRIKLNEHT
jgi:glutaconate CoA-transferase subunit A